MKYWVGKGLLFCFLLSLMSCAATMSMLIEVEKPADIALPVAVQDVIIVNNALPQPVGYGVPAPLGKNREVDSVYVRTLQLASWQVLSAAFKYMDNSKFFSNVSFYRKSLRRDNEWLTVVPVSEEIKNDFFENENFDLIISIDRLLFNSTIQSDRLETGKINTFLIFSAYMRGMDKPVITDSIKIYPGDIYFYDEVADINSGMFVNDLIIRYLSSALGEKLGKFFVPSWNSAERIYFVKNFLDEANIYNCVKKGEWLEAKTIWTDKFERAKKAADKAKMAINMALACEMTDKFLEAEDWAKKAKAFFQDASSKKYSKEINYLEGYLKTLQERELNNKKLNEQYGISERR